jgi:TolA-binding protein
MTVALFSTLMAGSVPISTHAASSGGDAQRGKARAELATVTIDVDRANGMYSPADNGLGSNYAEVVQYQQEYMAGRQSFEDGKYRDALQHLRKADQIIRSQPSE